MYSGLIIKESLNNEDILDCITVKNVELWKTDNTPRYWTAIFFESTVEDFPYQLSKALNHIKWYVDLKQEDTKYIVLQNIVLSYTIGDVEAKAKTIAKCLELGISQKQLDWLE